MLEIYVVIFVKKKHVEQIQHQHDMLDKEFSYFLSHKKELFKGYPNRFLLIKGEAVVKDFSTFKEAIDWATENGLELGTFLVQHCTENEDGYTQTFHSRVAFN